MNVVSIDNANRRTITTLTMADLRNQWHTHTSFHIWFSIAIYSTLSDSIHGRTHKQNLQDFKHKFSCKIQVGFKHLENYGKVRTKLHRMRLKTVSELKCITKDKTVSSQFNLHLRQHCDQVYWIRLTVFLLLCYSALEVLHIMRYINLLTYLLYYIKYKNKTRQRTYSQVV